MAVYKIFPTQDATIYSDKPNINSGLDEILEIRNLNEYKNSVARTLLKFDNLNLPAMENMDGGFEVNLKMYIAYASSLKENIFLNIYPLSTDWENGIGRYGDQKPGNEGATWNNASTNEPWQSSGGDLYPLEIYYPINMDSSKDIDVDITRIFEFWLESFNYGLLLKLGDEYEFNNSIESQPVLKYFSSNTHTIYPPHIEFKWDDSIWENINQLETVDNTELYINISNNKGEFYEGSINKFRVNVRPKYPQREYKIKSVFTDNWVLPENSCYAIKDLDTNEFIINFDESFTKLSCDKNGNYFNLYMNGLQPERYYEILIKSKIEEEVIILNNKMYFKIKRNTIN